MDLLFLNIKSKERDEIEEEINHLLQQDQDLVLLLKKKWFMLQI